jgi:hypothetical protein
MITYLIASTTVKTAKVKTRPLLPALLSGFMIKTRSGSCGNEKKRPAFVNSPETWGSLSVHISFQRRLADRVSVEIVLSKVVKDFGQKPIGIPGMMMS